MAGRLDAYIQALEAKRADIDARIEVLSRARDVVRADYDEDQPRDEGGRWTSGGGSAGGYRASEGKPFIVYRLASKDERSLRSRNAGNAQAVAKHIAKSQSNEGPAPAGGFGDTVHMYKVNVKGFGPYARMNQGRATDPTDPSKVGREGQSGDFTYSFAQTAEFEEEHLGAVPLSELNKHLHEWSKAQGKDYPDFDYAGSLAGGDAIRDYAEKHMAQRAEASLMQGNFGIERKNMPQFERGTEGDFLKRLQDRGHKVTYNETRKVSDIKATQSTLHMPVVRNMSIENQKSPIIVSDDGYVLDGHHRWAAVKLRDPRGEITAHRVGLPIQALLTEALNDPHSTRTDYDDDQPRDEGGKWTSGGGGGGGGSGPRAAKPKLLEASSSKFAINSIRAAISNDNWKPLRTRLEKSLADTGMPRRPGTSEEIFVAALPRGVNGAMDAGGRIALSPETRDRAEKFSELWGIDEDGVKERLGKIKDDISDPRNLELAEQVKGVHTIVHEAIHAHGPLEPDDWEGPGLAVEEITTEVASRVYMRDNFNYDASATWEAASFHESAEAVPAGIRIGNHVVAHLAYDPTINHTIESIVEHLDLGVTGRKTAVGVLERAAVAFKKSKKEDMPKWASTPAAFLAKAIVEAHGDEKYKTPDSLTRLTTTLMSQWRKTIG